VTPFRPESDPCDLLTLAARLMRAASMHGGARAFERARDQARKALAEGDGELALKALSELCACFTLKGDG
jgi:hypothetical protein